MKKHHALATLTVVIFFGFASCHKWDWDWFDKSKTDCDVQSYYLTEIGYGGPDPFLFEKKYNAARDRVTEITFTFLNLHPVEVPYQARLVYETDRFFAINKLNKKDTLMKVLLNSQGRVKKVYGKIHRDSIMFEYDHKQRLKVIAAEISAGGALSRDTCDYDDHGNILGITHRDMYGRVGYFYKYDYSRKAKRQFYLDEPVQHDEFALLQYLGYFPELEPKHVRIFSRIGLETGARLYEGHLTNHKFDSKGRLISYDSYHEEDFKYLYCSAIVNWKCR